MKKNCYLFLWEQDLTQSCCCCEWGNVLRCWNYQVKQTLPVFLTSASEGCTSRANELECELADAIWFYRACKACGSHSQLFLTILFTSLQEPGLFPPLSDSRVLHELCRGECCSLVRVVGLGGSDPEKRCRSFSRPEDRLHRGFHKFLQIFLLKEKRKEKVRCRKPVRSCFYAWKLFCFSGLYPLCCFLV